MQDQATVARFGGRAGPAGQAGRTMDDAGHRRRAFLAHQDTAAWAAGEGGPGRMTLTESRDRSHGPQDTPYHARVKPPSPVETVLFSSKRGEVRHIT